MAGFLLANLNSNTLAKFTTTIAGKVSLANHAERDPGVGVAVKDSAYFCGLGHGFTLSFYIT
jgi:hypothetical protein